MNLQQIPYVPFSEPGATPGRTTIGHSHFWDRAMSRRNMLLGTVAAAGVMVGGRILPPRFGTVAGATTTAAEPRPIPGGFLVLDDRRYHAYIPGRVDPLDPDSPINEPSTITDFDGVVAITQAQGTGMGVEHGVEVPLTFDADMRFMAGRYVGRDGQTYEGQFGFIWLDVYVSQVGSVPAAGQIHDYSPGISEDGLFWTIAVPPEAVGFDPDLQTGFYRRTDLDVVDAFNIPNALAGGPEVPGRVSFEVQWLATGPPIAMRNDVHGFTGQFRESRATIAWSGSTDTSRFASAPGATSNSIYGFIGRERNGVFF